MVKEDIKALLFINIFFGSHLLSNNPKEFLIDRFNVFYILLKNNFLHRNLNISKFQNNTFDSHNIELFENQLDENFLYQYRNAIKCWDFDRLPYHAINNELKKIDFKFLFKKNSILEFNFLNMILNIFFYDDFQKLYIFHTIAAILKKNDEF